MFVDASAIIAIIADEDDKLALIAKIETADRILISGLAYFEAAAGLARIRRCSPEAASALVDLFIEETAAQFVPIEQAVGQVAVTAFSRFGKGRHKADLNMGDCFAYACAQSSGVPLLFKGNDFIHTNIASA